MTLSEIDANIKQKYKDAALLESHGSYSNAMYLLGYCAELALKYAITKHLHWTSFTEKCLLSHDLSFLYKFTGKGQNAALYSPLNAIDAWDPKHRYNDPSLAKAGEYTTYRQAVQKIAFDLCNISLP